MQDSAADVGPAVTNWRESRPLSSIRLKPDQDGVSGLGNPWPAEAAQAGPEASSGDDLRDDDTEPLPLFAAPAAAPPKPSPQTSSAHAASGSSFAPGGEWWNHIADVQAGHAGLPGRTRRTVGLSRQRVCTNGAAPRVRWWPPTARPCPSLTHGRSPSPEPAVAAVVNVASGGAPAGATTSARTAPQKYDGATASRAQPCQRDGVRYGFWLTVLKDQPGWTGVRAHWLHAGTRRHSAGAGPGADACDARAGAEWPTVDDRTKVG